MGDKSPKQKKKQAQQKTGAKDADTRRRADAQAVKAPPVVKK